MRKEENEESERERDKQRNRPTGKKARRSPLAPSSTAYKREENVQRGGGGGGGGGHRIAPKGARENA